MTFTKGYIPWNKGLTIETDDRILKLSNKGKSPWNKGKPQSEEQNKKNSESHKGQIAWNKDKKQSETTKQKISQKLTGKKQSDETKNKRSIALKGRIYPSRKGLLAGAKHPMYGKTHTEEAKKKISDAHIGKCIGKENPHWRGGETMSTARTRNKRRLLGYIPLNIWEAKTKDFVAHHLDKEHVLYIPKDLHNSVRHKQENQESMDVMNEKAIDWYVEYYGLK